MLTPRQRFALFVATRYTLADTGGMRPAWWLVDDEVRMWLKDYDRRKAHGDVR